MERTVLVYENRERDAEVIDAELVLAWSGGAERVSPAWPAS